MTEFADFQQFSASCLARCNGALASELARADTHPRLQQAMNYAVQGGGKRIRPLLVYAANQALGGALAAADAPAVAVELIHAYSLAHDDLPAMDNDDLRRGKPTTHIAFDEATAILVGDALQTLAFEVLAADNPDLPGPLRLALIGELGSAAGSRGMVAGQAMDFDAVGENPGLDALQRLHRLKTGALIRAAVVMGGLSSNRANTENLGNLADFADAIGLAVQIQDDILDDTSDTATLGKPQGSDRELNKPTYTSLLGLAGAQEKAAEQLQHAMDAIEVFGDQARLLRELARLVVERRS